MLLKELSKRSVPAGVPAATWLAWVRGKRNIGVRGLRAIYRAYPDLREELVAYVLGVAPVAGRGRRRAQREEAAA